MKFLDRVFGVFSRSQLAEEFSHEVPGPTRRRVFIWLEGVFSNERAEFSKGDYRLQFWTEINQWLRLRHGEFSLTGDPSLSPAADAANFLLRCDAESFLDFLEYIFRVKCFFHVSLPEDTVIDELNDLLQVDNLPYHLTRFVRRDVTAERRGAQTLLGGPRYTETVELPRVVMRESDVTHTQAVQPALELLSRPCFQQANHEFLDALEDYRRGDLGDCLTKCGSSFESVLKVICAEKGWSYNQNDTAGVLVHTVVENSGLASFFEQQLLLVATIRNRYSTSHGGGTAPRVASRQVARFALNSTAATMLLLAEETGLG